MLEIYFKSSNFAVISYRGPFNQLKNQKITWVASIECQLKKKLDSFDILRKCIYNFAVTGAVRVISSDPPPEDGNVRLTTVPLKP